MADEHILASFVKRNSFQPTISYEEQSLASQLFMPKASRPSLEAGMPVNLPLSRNGTCHSPRSTTWSDDLIKAKRTRMSDLPCLSTFNFPSHVPVRYDRADNLSQRWGATPGQEGARVIDSTGTILSQAKDGDTADVDFMTFLRPYSALGDVAPPKRTNSIQTVFIGPPHAHFGGARQPSGTPALNLQINSAASAGTQLIDVKSNLELIILKIFYRERIVETDLCLASRDYSILNAIFQRKFLKAVDLEPLDADKEQLIRVVENLTSFSSSKRPEECHKFVLSKTFKYLRKTFKHSSGVETDDATEFYEHYFRDAANRLGIDISAFYFPSKSKTVKNPNSFNSDYFAKLFTSASFVAALREYMTSMIFADHRDEIKKKIEKIMDKWSRMFAKSGQPVEKTLAVIKHEVVKNKKFKLPWTFSELHEAIFRVNELIEVIVGG